MTTEITAAVTYFIEGYSYWDDQWISRGAVYTNKEEADAKLAALRAAFATPAYRLVLVTTTTKVIA